MSPPLVPGFDGGERRPEAEPTPPDELRPVAPTAWVSNRPAEASEPTPDGALGELLVEQLTEWRPSLALKLRALFASKRLGPRARKWLAAVPVLEAVIIFGGLAGELVKWAKEVMAKGKAPEVKPEQSNAVAPKAE